MVLLGVVIGECEMPSTNILQDNEHAILLFQGQFVAYNFRQTAVGLNLLPC
jgi:hypothetical protein